LGRQEVRSLWDGDPLTFFDSLDSSAVPDTLGLKI